MMATSSYRCRECPHRAEDDLALNAGFLREEGDMTPSSYCGRPEDKPRGPGKLLPMIDIPPINP
jgi:hypothetical protein